MLESKKKKLLYQYKFHYNKKNITQPLLLQKEWGPIKGAPKAVLALTNAGCP